MKSCLSAVSLLDAGSGNVTTTGCKPADLSSQITYSGTEKSECTIIISQMSETDSATWSVRVDAQMKNTEMVS